MRIIELWGVWKESSLKAQDVIKLLKEDGWYLYDIKGSHHQFKHAVKPGKVTVPVHSGDLTPGTLNSIIKQSGIVLPKK